MTSKITIRIDSDFRQEVEELFARFGMDISMAVDLFLRESIRCQGFPFIITRRLFSNTKMIATIAEKDLNL